MKQDKTQKDIKASMNPFRHCEHRMIFFETFFHGEDLHYVLQCEAKDFYVGVTDYKFTLLSTGTISDRIACASYCEGSKKLYMGSNKGHLLCWEPFKEEQEVQRSNSINGDCLIGVLACSGAQGDEVVTISKSGHCLLYRDMNCEKQCKFPEELNKVAINKQPSNELDIWIVLFFKSGNPMVLDFNWFKRFMLTQTFKDGLDSYSSSVTYEEDDEVQMPKAVVAACVSNSMPLLIVAEEHIISVFLIQKSGGFFSLEFDFQFKHEGVQQIDLYGSQMLLMCDQGITAYSVQKRAKIANNLKFKGSTSFDIMRWADSSKRILLGNTNKNTMKLNHFELNLK